MRYSLVRTALAFVVTGLCLCVFGVAAATPDVGVQNVNLACNDGTNLNLGLDPASLTALTGAVSAINTTPAGLSCGTSQAPAQDGGKKDLAVGGGQVIADCTFYGGSGLIHQSFALSAHVDADTLTDGVGGTFNLDIGRQGGACPVYGHVVAKIDCLSVTGNHAVMTAVITQSNGTLLGPDVVGSEEQIAVTDNGALPDTIEATQANARCAFIVPFESPIDHGNINVRDAAP